MGFLHRLGTALQVLGGGPPGDVYDPAWYMDVVPANDAGIRITPEGGLASSAVYACVQVIANGVAQLPGHVYRRLPGGGREVVPGHPVATLFTEESNPTLNSFEFRELMQACLLLRGNSYAEIVRGSGYSVEGLYPIDPRNLTVERVSRGRVAYKVQEQGRSRTLLMEDVLHLRGLSTNGLVGLSPITVQRNSVGLAIAAERFGAATFARRPMMAGVLQKKEGTAKASPEQMKATAESFRAAHSGIANSHSVAVLPPGYEWEAIGISHKDAQFLETRQFQRSEIAGWFLVPPHMIGDLSRATFSNIEQQSIDFVTRTLIPWLRRWEAVIQARFLAGTPYYFRFSVDGLLRGVQRDRYEGYSSALAAGWLSVDEVRELEERNPLGGQFAYPRSPLNTAPAPAARPGKPAPAGDDDDPEDGD